jgi:hypothetical protein
MLHATESFVLLLWHTLLVSLKAFLFCLSAGLPGIFQYTDLSSHWPFFPVKVYTNLPSLWTIRFLLCKNPTSLWVWRVTKFWMTFWIHRACAFFVLRIVQGARAQQSARKSWVWTCVSSYIRPVSKLDQGVMGHYYCPPVEGLSFRCSYVAGKSTVTISFCSALLCRLAPTTQWYYQQCAVFLPKLSAIFACKPWWKEYIFIFPWNFWRLIHYLDMG